MKKTTLPISATVAYDQKSDTVLLTSADRKLEGSRFRVALRKDTVEDLKLRQLLNSAAEDAGEKTELPEAVVPATPIPAPLQGLNGLIPLGTGYNNEPVHWNTSRNPNAIIVAQDPHERAAFTEMLLATVRSQEDWIYYPLSTGRSDSPFGRWEWLEDNYLTPRYEEMRKEGVVWYSESSNDYKKVLVVVEAADTLRPDEERLLNRILTLGPAAGVTVVAISASKPDWQDRTFKNFAAKLALCEYDGKYSLSSNTDLLQNHSVLSFVIEGPHSAVLEMKGTFTPVRFYGMPE